MKVLYFGEPIPEILVEGNKNSTFRVCDSQNIRQGDLISFLLPDDTPFAEVQCTGTKMTRFEDLTPEDWEGHERFPSDVKMFEIYSNWEKRPITKSDSVKIIRFEYRTFCRDAVLEYLGRDRSE
ncbi:ASCH domain-containing protein [archaeon]|jgi:hypothetical protein|nr:ASCH domain-containing protein [archaeon]MBT3578026.1 ASCH domain-containing protein [archaeon]MBT6820001.1 ASCH domain-containing protein [archaeon]MBT6955705.1 ASCH domain-containing protein [archaeon]MBT7025038.1 ASCH domain-containing protein [archaeon]